MPADRFNAMLSGPDEDINLAEAALLIASDEYANLDVAAYLARLDDLAQSLKRRLRADISPADTITALNRFLFDEHRFTGNAADYYDPRNSFLNEVMDRRLGIPISLAVLYIEVGRRLGLPLDGVSFPAHFLVKCTLREGMVVLDPYAKGISLSFAEIKKRVKSLFGGEDPPQSVVAQMLGSASNKDILVRMLRNLKGIYSHHCDWRRALAVTDRIITAMPDHADEYRDRGMMYLNLECFRAALFDLQVYLNMKPEAQDAETVRAKMLELQAAASRLN